MIQDCEMAEIVLPSVLHNSLLELLSKSRLCSWNIHGGTKFTSLTIKFDSTQGSHFESTGYRRKSPSELRRDEQRAALHREKVQVLSSTPAEHASSVTEEDDRRSDISNSSNGENIEHLSEIGDQLLLQEMRAMTESFREDARKSRGNDDLDQCMDTRQVIGICGYESSEVNSSLSDSLVHTIMTDWIDKDVTFSLCTIKPSDRDKIIQSMKENGPNIDTIVHDKRLGANDLIARTKDFIFVFDLNMQKMSDYRVVCQQTNSMWPQRDFLKCLVNWPQCDKMNFSKDIDLLQTHVKAFYKSLLKRVDE